MIHSNHLQRPGFVYGIHTITEKAINDVKEVLKTLNDFLEENEFFASENLSIADISILASVTSFDVCTRVTKF